MHGALSDTLNEGIAGFLLELSFTGGVLSPTDEPVIVPMLSFTRPNGITGPVGFGGQAVDGRLVDVGGAQNVVKNTPGNAPFPIGEVITGVAQTETVLVTGTLTVPSDPGTYTLSVTKLLAAAIVQGEDGSGEYWATEPVGMGTVSDLMVIVLPPGQSAAATNDGPACPGDTVTLHGQPDGMLNYHWTGPNGFTSFQQNPTVSPAVAGTYTLTVTDANGCPSTSATTVYTEPDPIAAGESPRYLAVTPETCVDAVALYVTGDANDPQVSCLMAFVQADGTLGPSPWLQDAAAWGTVHVRDAAIIPGADYTVYDVYDAAVCPDLLSAAPASVTSSPWGDLNGDGLVNGHDLLIFIDAYLGDALYWKGDLGPQVPDGQVDGDDLLCWIDAYYAEPYPYTSCDGGAAAKRTNAQATASLSLGTARLSIEPTVIRAKPGQTVSVDVFVEGVRGLRLCQVSLQARGGLSVIIELSDVVVDSTRQDYAFAGMSPLTIPDPNQHRAVSALWEGGADVMEERRYVGTFEFVSSRDARGIFRLALDGEPLGEWPIEAIGARVETVRAN